MGAWVGKNQTEIEQYFHLKLPGLRDVNSSSSAQAQAAHLEPILGGPYIRMAFALYGTSRPDPNMLTNLPL
jgi:hypothetical protein